MDRPKLKRVWAATIASDDWDAAPIELSYGAADRASVAGSEGATPVGPSGTLGGTGAPELREGAHAGNTNDYGGLRRGARGRLPRATFTGAQFEAARYDAAQLGIATEKAPRPAIAQTVVIVGDSSEPGADTIAPQEDVSALQDAAKPVITVPYHDDAMLSGATIIEDGAIGESTQLIDAQPVAAFVHSNANESNHATLDSIGGSSDDIPPSAPRARHVSGIELRDSGASYKIVDEIGRGGMGVIYRATQSSLDRAVAVKTLIPQRANEKSREKFVSEALVTGSLDHPNVVPVHELGANQDGEVFLAMKLVDGRSWKDLLHPATAADEKAAEGYTLNKHIEILLDVANAISFAHSKGILHRDLKPENVMVGAYGETLVMDWGIAVDIREPQPESTRAPHKSTVRGPAGTPVYMSPEQAEGRGDGLGAHTDVYLLGAILHELITGRPPHQREGCRLLDVLVTASQSVAPEYDEDIPRALQEICRTAMAREPQDRYQTVAQFSDAVSTWMGHRASLMLADQADALAGEARSDSSAAHEQYGLFTRALARYEQSLLAWPENRQALRGQAVTSIAYADEALARKDFGVVEAQLTLLEGHPEVDRSRVAQLATVLGRQRASRVRAAVAFVLIVVSTVAAYRGLQAVADRAERDAAIAAGQHAFDRKAQEAWMAVATGDLLEVSRAETRLAEDPKARSAEGRDRVNSVRGAKKLMLWQQRRFQELFNIQCRDFRSGLRSAGGGDPPVSDRLALTRVGELLRRAADDPSSRSLCKVFEAELAGGTPAKTVLSAFDEMQKTAPAAAQKRLLRRRRLLDAATCEMAPVPVELALQSTETDVCLFKALPFIVASPPVGPKLRQRTRPPVMRRGKHQEWVALDRGTRKELWRTSPPGDDVATEAVVPVADGSVLIGNGAFLRRHHGQTGRVLGRIVLPSAPLLVWPDSLDRRRLRAIVWTNRDQGRVGVLTWVAGRATQPAFKSDTFEAWGRTSPLVIALEQRKREEIAEELGVAPSDDDPRLRMALFKALIAQARLDPYEPDFAVRALQVVGGDLAVDKRARVADHAIRASKGLLPVHVVRIGNALLRSGFPRRADQLYEQAASDFLEGHGNPDLAGFRIGNPASLLRRLGGELFADGDIDTALHLVETGHRFATVMEGDTLFYQRYLRWLEQQGRPDPDGKVAAIAQRAAEAGGVMMLAPFDLMLTDVAAVTVVLAPLLLLLLLLRLWYVARQSRIAALYTQGLRTGRDRVYAFLSDPWMRVRHTFWSYATRGQRLLVLLTAGLAILSATTLASNLTILGQTVTAPLHLAFGYPGQPAFLADVRAGLDREGRDPALLRLLAEGLRARGRTKDVDQSLQSALDLDPGDPIARNNLAVLREEAGDDQGARELYVESARSVGSGAAVARWNLARLAASSALPTGQLAHRDQIRARRYGAKKPLWALCSLEDQRRLLVPRQTLAERALWSFSQLVRGEFGHFAGAHLGRASLYAKALRGAMGVAAVLCLLIGAIALLWLPLTTLPLLEERAGSAPVARSGARRFLTRLASALIPGLRGILGNHGAAGASLLLALSVLAGLWFAIDVHGLVSSMLDLGASSDYFPGVEAPSVHSYYRPVGDAAGVAVVLVFVVNVVVELRARRQAKA